MVRLKNLLIPCFLVVTMLAHAQDYAQFVTVEEAKAVRPPRSVSDVFKMLDQHQPDPGPADFAVGRGVGQRQAVEKVQTQRGGSEGRQQHQFATKQAPEKQQRIRAHAHCVLTRGSTSA